MLQLYTKRNSVQHPRYFDNNILKTEISVNQSSSELQLSSQFKFNDPPGTLRRNPTNKHLQMSRRSSLQHLDSTIDQTKISYREVKRDSSGARFAPESESIMNLLQLD